MKQITTAMCESAEGDYFHDYINRQVAVAQEKRLTNVVVPIWAGYKPEIYRLLMQSKGFHVEFWEATEYSPESLYIAW